MTAAVVEPLAADDQRAFAVLVRQHRRELHRHCARMLRSSERAEDVVQEALLRAWRARGHVADRATVRGWLYRIATNACLDEIRRTRSRPRPLLPADLEDAAEPPETSAQLAPDTALEVKEALQRAFLAAIELLPPRQRAVLILCEVLRCPAAESARLLGTSVAAVNSALQRARGTLSRQGAAARPDRGPGPGPGSAERVLIDRYVDAVRRHDVAGLIALARADDAARPLKLVIGRA
jgi:RNA polymerase sigma-70 factor (TIGR02960 family)